MEEGISIIICCYNSSSRLPQTLEHIAKQKVASNIKWEIIVVNNASEDNTWAVAEKEWAKYGVNIPFVIVEQPKPGLSFAREKGIESTSYSNIIFCDDDNHLDANYIQTAAELLLSMPEVGILGGESKPLFASSPGDWVKDMYPALAIGPQAKEDGYVSWVFGAGMVIRKSIFEEIRRRDIRLELKGREGKKSTFGEDAEICNLTRFLGYKIYYSSKLIFMHYMSASRLTKKYFIRIAIDFPFPAIVLAIYNALSENKDHKYLTFYFKRLWDQIYFTFYFLPRIVIGKHRFYSVVHFLQSAKLFFIYLIRAREIHQTFKRIKLVRSKLSNY